MFSCISCLNPRGYNKLSDLTNIMKDMSLRCVMKQHKTTPGSGTDSVSVSSWTLEKEMGGVGDDDEETNEWVAEEEPGVLITLVSLPLGGNRLKKIRFREEYFDDRKAQQWWSDNCEMIMALHNVIQYSNTSSTPPHSDDEQSQQSQETSCHHSSKSANRKRGTTFTRESEVTDGVQGESTETAVVEDCPGVYLTVRSLPDGSRELMHVDFSREHFGMVKARVWWEENKVRVHQQYSNNG